MKAKVENLKERISQLNNTVGEMNFEEIEKKHMTSSVIREKLENISDVILKLQKEIKENDNITLKDVHRKSKTYLL